MHCKCNVDFRFLSEHIKNNQLTAKVETKKNLGFQVVLENDGPEPAYEMVFKIDSTILLDLKRMQSDCELEDDSQVSFEFICLYLGYIVKIMKLSF